MDKINKVVQGGIILFSGIGLYTLYTVRYKKEKHKIMRKNSSEFKDEMDALVNARIPRMNNQIAFNLRDPNFSPKFFEK
jgi:hypothetical protein